MIRPEEPIPGKTLPLTVMAVAVGTFASATWFMLDGHPLVSRWYFGLAWWPYILFVQSWLRLRGFPGNLYQAPGAFLSLLPLSVVVWLVFEVFNFRLGNWHYLGLPAALPERWAGYALSFATVLPGLFTTSDLLEDLGLFRQARVPALENPRRLFLPFLVLGSLCYLLPLVWPRFFFPLVWGSFVFLLEPINYQMGAPSLLRAWKRGSAAVFLRLLAAGAVCGLLWEMWNFRAGAKWIYTVPFVGEWKVFEMPVLGFLGFPPFAVECYAMVNFLRTLGVVAEENPSRPRRILLWGLVLCAGLAFVLVTFRGIDALTVIDFRP